MSFVTISEAAKLAKIARSNLYKNYIQTGKITVSHDARNRPVIDIAELHRVFGDLKREDSKNRTQEDIEGQKVTGEGGGEDSQDIAENARLQAENDALRERLREYQDREDEARERETWLRGQVDKLTDTMKLLEAPKKTQEAPKSWWFSIFR